MMLHAKYYYKILLFCSCALLLHVSYNIQNICITLMHCTAQYRIVICKNELLGGGLLAEEGLFEEGLFHNLALSSKVDIKKDNFLN